MPWEAAQRMRLHSASGSGARAEAEPGFDVHPAAGPVIGWQPSLHSDRR